MISEDFLTSIRNLETSNSKILVIINLSEFVTKVFPSFLLTSISSSIFLFMVLLEGLLDPGAPVVFLVYSETSPFR